MTADASTIFIIGLRRSGTTVLFDILQEDMSSACFYEPLCAGRATPGGGSGIKPIDHNADLRRFRMDFAARHGLPASNAPFNFGAPRDVALEAGDHDLGDMLRAYLREMAEVAPHTVLKFVRATFLVSDLHAIAPQAVLVHVRKNPLRFVVSHLIGRRRARGPVRELARRLVYGPTLTLDDLTADRVFTKRRTFDTWSQERVADHYLRTLPHGDILRRKPAYYRLLLLWKHFNERIETDARRLFGDRYVPITNEQLARDPAAVLGHVYEAADLPVSEAAVAWGVQHLKPPRPLPFADDPRWREAFNELGIDSAYLDPAAGA